MRLSKLERRKKEQELLAEIKTWVYTRPNETTPPLEEAWIIHSQIEWKGSLATAAELWEDMPFTDPAVIQFMLQNNEESLIPLKTLESLQASINKLQQIGVPISNQFFSLNWSKNHKTHKGGRFLEVKRILAPYQTSPKEKLKTLLPQKEKNSKKKGKKPSKGGILSFLGL